MNYNNFYEAKAKGHIGEAAVAEYLSEQGYFTQDLTNDPEFYHLGDLLATNDVEEPPYFIEVKTDSRAAATGNLVIEFTTNKAENKDGWFKTSQTDVFAFFLEGDNSIIFIDADELREKYISALTRIIETHQYECGVYYKEGIVGLLSIEKLSKFESFKRVQLTEELLSRVHLDCE